MKIETIQIFCDRCGKEIPKTESKMIRAKGVRFKVEVSSVGYDGARGGYINEHDYPDLCNDCSEGLLKYLKIK
jgi:hypothetical protein